MLVGNAWALDSGQEETRLGCGLPSVPTYSVSPEFANAADVPGGAQPGRRLPGGLGGQIAELFPDEVKNATVMFGNFAATIDTKDKVLQTFDDFGFEFLDCPIEYNIAGEPDWKPFAQRLSDCRAEVVYYAGQPTPTCRTCSTTPRRSATARSGSPTPTPTSSRSPTGTHRQRRPRVPPHGVHPVRAGGLEPGDPAVPRHRDRARRRHQPAGRAGHVVLPAVGHGGQGVRRRPDPAVRARRAGQGHQLDRRRATPSPTPAGTCPRVLDAPQARRHDLGAGGPEEQGEFDCNPDGASS